ncbi:MAG: Ig-like domain-containing protein [Saprospiraceae bacterium]|nr:Ig-like domain-containing protein [Saprospiraceae bacterium]
MAYGPNGDLFVSSSFGDAILRYNGQTGAFISTFVSAGSGGLDEARGLTFGPDGNLYVNSYNTDQVKRYNGTTGAFIDNFVLSTTGLNGPHTSLLFSPDGFLYVASLDNDKVMKFNGSTGALVASYDFSIFSELSGADFGPRAMVFGPDGNLYVGTRTNNIYKITLSTGIITVWGTSGLSEYYSGVNFGPDGRLYAVAVSGGTVRRFNYPSGTYLDRFDSGGTLGEPKMITFSPKCGSCPASLPSGNLCLGATLQLSPASGGMWTSNNPSVATITNSGLVTAVSVGVATFTFVNSTTACSSTTSNLTVNTNPSAAGASTVCVGETASVTPGTNGIWTSSNTAIATITNAGVVSGISAGSVTFTYTRTADGCTATWPFTVLANPVAPLIGTITQPTCSSPTGSVVLTGLPSTGTWTITRLPGGTTYSGSGTSYTVTGLPSNTTYTFRVTNANTCTSVPSSDVVINTPPSAPSLGGASAICAGSSANVTPSTNGTWTSSNNSVATITNVGVVNGLTAGTVTLTYTRSSDGCSNSTPFTVYALPSAPVIGTITHPTCITATGSVLLNGLPSSGTWTITRTPGGNTYTGTGTSYTVTGLTPNTSFTFIVTNADLCTSSSSNIVAINAIPANPVLGGAASVCTGATANVTPSSNGTWSSANNGIATITNAGLVTGVSAGSVILTYTRTSDGLLKHFPFTVYSNPSAPVPGTVTQPICTTPTGSVILSGLPSSGTWTITRTPGGKLLTPVQVPVIPLQGYLQMQPIHLQLQTAILVHLLLLQLLLSMPSRELLLSEVLPVYVPALQPM